VSEGADFGDSLAGILLKLGCILFVHSRYHLSCSASQVCVSQVIRVVEMFVL
jgi:hypothetical protein